MTSQTLNTNQNNLNRNLNGTLESRLLDERSAEEVAIAFIREREEIRERLKEEKKEREERTRDYGLNPDNLRESLKERITDKIIEKIPTPLSLPIQVIEWAEENKNKVQGLLLGIDDNNKPPVKNIPQDNGLDPFQAPPINPAQPPTEASNTWKKLMAGDNVGKSVTLKWKYEGWVSFLTFNNPTSGQTQQLGSRDETGYLIPSVRGITPGNPVFTPQDIAGWLGGSHPWAGISGRLTTLDPRYRKGWHSDITEPAWYLDGNSNAAANWAYPTGFYRINWYGSGKVITSTRFHMGGGRIQWFHYVKINYKALVTIGIESNWYAGTRAAFYPNDRLIRQYFECPFNNQYNNEVGLCEPEIDPLNVARPTRNITPPPPERCDCMSCCENADTDELKRLIRKLVKTIGEPKEVTLWDDDLSKPGRQIKKKTPKDSFEHLKLLTDRIEVALRIIGITDLPIEVDESRSFYPKLGEFYSKSSDPQIQKLGEALLKRDRRTITSVFQALDWYGDALDEKLGDWESTIQFNDIDLVREGNQNVELHHANVQDALHDTMKFAFQGGIHSEASFNLIAKTMGDVATLKKEIMGQTYKLDLLIDYLGMGYTETSENLPISVSFSESAMTKLANKELGEYLTDSTIPIARPLLGEKEVNLSVRLAELENAVGTIQAAHRMPITSLEIAKELLKRLGKGEDWKNFLADMQKFADENEMQIEIGDITNDKEKLK